jgi:hypothetical protein
MNSFLTIGQCSAVLQVMPAAIRDAANDLCIRPTQINFVDSFTEEQLEQISHYVRSKLNDNSVLASRVSGLR